MSNIEETDKQKRLSISRKPDVANGADYRIRTYDLLITNELLYQLS